MFSLILQRYSFTRITISEIKNHYKTYRIWIVAVAMVSLVALAAGIEPNDLVVETGPYQLIYPDNFGNRIFIPSDNLLTKEGVYLGRMLFYEPLLSANNKVSCSTCHQQQLAFTDGRAFGKGIDDTLTVRSTMSLSNLLWMKNFLWDGRANGLEAQASVPITNPHEMGQSLADGAGKLKKVKPYPYLFRLVYGDDSITGERMVKAIAQFERTLISSNSRYDQYLRGEYKPDSNELNGMNLFMTIPDPSKMIRGANCGRCHGTVKTFIELYHNNGLDSLPKDIGREAITGIAIDKGRFRVPTLRNIALTAPYMHDGRFKTLEEVVEHYNEHIIMSPALSPLLRDVSNKEKGKDLALTRQEQKDILSFMKMLTDSTFISDKRFADPHVYAQKNNSN